MSTDGIPGQPELSRHRPDPIVKNCTELIGGGVPRAQGCFRVWGLQRRVQRKAWQEAGLGQSSLCLQE